MARPDTPKSLDPLVPTSVGAWLGVLILLLLMLISIGGFVRLSGSGLSIPEWPLVNGSLLPPMSDAAWDTVHQEFVLDQQRLQEAKHSGAYGIGSLGRVPADLGEFKVMFLIEWSHRAMGAIIGIVALACLTITLRHRSLRQRIGGHMIGLVVLIVCQATLGGILVKSGTATHFLFLHLGMAAIILSLVVWSLLRVLQGNREDVSADASSHRIWLRRATTVAWTVTWIQLVLGALVAGSRAGGAVVATWPQMGNTLIPANMWSTYQSVTWNLIDNAILHQWVHRWFAFVVVAAVIWLFALSRRSKAIRMRLGAHLALGLIVGQIFLGLMNVFAGAGSVLVALAHLVTGMLLLAGLTQVAFDVRNEPDGTTESESNPKPNLAMAGGV